MADKLLSINQLNVSFNTPAGAVHVVKDVNLHIERRQTMALVGESGSGKSVTALSILRLHHADKVNYHQQNEQNSQILYHGSETEQVVDLLRIDINALRKIRGSKIAMIFQEPMTSLNPTFSIGYQISEALMLHENLSAKEAKKRTIELLALTEIKNPQQRYDAYPHMLSGGQRQRVMIAMALACKPELLIADEPTTALDVTVQLQILQLLEKLQQEFSMSILLITHNLNLVKKFAQKVAVMQSGVLVEQNNTEQLFAAPKHPYTQQLLNSQPKPMLDEQSTAMLENKPSLFVGKNIDCRFNLSSGFFQKSHWLKAVDQVSINLRSGETLGIVGESGSGKSTLARCLLRLQDCEGEISFDDQRLDQLSFKQLRPLRQHFQMVFQDPFSSLSPRMTIEQIIGEGLNLHFPQLKQQQKLQKIITMLKEVGLDESALWRYPHEFSGGQRQRIAIARVLILEPKVLLLDEPTSALDVSVQKQVLELLKRLQDKYQISYLFISHDLKVIESISHFLLVMKDGRIVEQGKTKAIFENPREDYTKQLLNASQLNFSDKLN